MEATTQNVPQKRTLTSPEITINPGKIPPQAINIEKLVLGTLMIDKRGLDDAIELLSPEVFYEPAHQEIFAVIYHLFSSTGKAIDYESIIHELKKRSTLQMVGGEYYILELSKLVSSSAHIDFHTRIILEKYILRKLISISSEVVDLAYREETDVFNLLDNAERQLFDVTNNTIKKGFDQSDNLAHEFIKHLKAIAEKGGISGVPSGFNAIDKVTGGWQNSDLIIIAARPGMGKTAFVISTARNMSVQHQVPVAIFSLEMSSLQIFTRLISLESGVSSEKLKKGLLDERDWELIYQSTGRLEQTPIYIDDTPSLSVFDFRAKCRRLVSQHGVKVIMVDYLQLMTAQDKSGKNNGNREQEISTISRSLKAIAKELNVPIIVLSQLSRAVESRGGEKRPMLSDLRESGAIEQDADIVAFLYRPEYYKLTEWPDGSSCENQAEFIVAKHRNGSLEDIRLKFLGEQTKFSDLEDNSYSFSTDVIASAINTRIQPTQAFADNDEDVPF